MVDTSGNMVDVEEDLLTQTYNASYQIISLPTPISPLAVMVETLLAWLDQ